MTFVEYGCHAASISLPSSFSPSVSSGSSSLEKRISSAKPYSTAFFAFIQVSFSMSWLILLRESPVFFWYALMMLAFTSFRVLIAFSISLALPMAMVIGSWTISMATGLIRTRSPAMATTEAADAAIASIFTVIFPLWSQSMV